MIIIIFDIKLLNYYDMIILIVMPKIETKIDACCMAIDV